MNKFWSYDNEGHIWFDDSELGMNALSDYTARTAFYTLNHSILYADKEVNNSIKVDIIKAVLEKTKIDPMRFRHDEK